MKRIAVIVLIGLGLIGGAAAYHYETEEVTVPTKCEVRCHATGHQGDTLLRTEKAKVVVPRWRARSVGVQEVEEICPACEAREKRLALEERLKEERRREAEEAKTKIPNLLGKSFKEITSLLGEPSSVKNDIISFNWYYNNRSVPGYNMSIDFLDYLHTRTRIGYPTRTNRAHSIIVTGGDSLAVARTILQAKILNDSPARIYFYPEKNELLLKWHKGESPYWYDPQTGPKRDPTRKFTYYAELTVTGGDQKIYTLNRWLDTNTGDYKQSYKVTADWKDCLVEKFEQVDGCRGQFDLYEEEDNRCIRIK